MRSKKLKFITACLLVIITSSTLSGCGSKVTEKNTTKNVTALAKINENDEQSKPSTKMANDNNIVISQTEAVDIVKKLNPSLPTNNRILYYVTTAYEGKEYYCVRLYKEIPDEKIDAMQYVTIKWFFVERKTGDVYTVNTTERKFVLYAANTKTKAKTTDAKTKKSETVKDSKQYTRYTNDKHNLSVDYPKAFKPNTLLDGEDLVEEFVSEDGQITIKVITVNYLDNSASNKASTYYTEYLHDKSNLSYQELKSNWFAVKYSKNNKTFYHKSFAIGNGQLKTLEIQYPSSREIEFKPTVEHIISTFSVSDTK